MLIYTNYDIYPVICGNNIQMHHNVYSDYVAKRNSKAPRNKLVLHKDSLKMLGH